MSTLLNLTGQLDAETVATLSNVDDVATRLDIPYIIVGATARDLILHHGYGAPVQRATSDIDYAIQVDSWSTFEAVRLALCARGFTETNMQHRLANTMGKPIDIVPFGAQVEKNSTIAWPPNGDIIMMDTNWIRTSQGCSLPPKTPYPCFAVTPSNLKRLARILQQSVTRSAS